MEALLREPTQAPDETNLVERFRAGDRAAFDEIVTLHRSMVYTVARRLLRKHEEADEAAQVAFVRAWEARSRFRDLQSFILLDVCRPFPYFLDSDCQIPAPSPHQTIEQTGEKERTWLT